MSNHFWNDGMDELLIAMWGKQTTAEIAYVINTQFPDFGGVSRNAVIGRATRLRELGHDLQRQPSPIKRHKRIIEVEPVATGPSRPGHPDGCRWIEGELPGVTCCQPTHLGTSWCSDHYHRVFNLKPIKEKAA